MPKISTYRKSRWLRKEDVLALSPAQRRTVVVRLKEEEVGEETKLVCYFRDITKGWPINWTGLETLEEITASDNTDNFVGVPVEIYVDPAVKYQGKRIGGIKLRARKLDDIDEAMGPGPLESELL